MVKKNKHAQSTCIEQMVILMCWALLLYVLMCRPYPRVVTICIVNFNGALSFVVCRAIRLRHNALLRPTWTTSYIDSVHTNVYVRIRRIVIHSLLWRYTDGEPGLKQGTDSAAQVISWVANIQNVRSEKRKEAQGVSETERETFGTGSGGSDVQWWVGIIVLTKCVVRPLYSVYVLSYGYTVQLISSHGAPSQRSRPCISSTAFYCNLFVFPFSNKMALFMSIMYPFNHVANFK